MIPIEHSSSDKTFHKFPNELLMFLFHFDSMYTSYTTVYCAQ